MKKEKLIKPLRQTVGTFLLLHYPSAVTGALITVHEVTLLPDLSVLKLGLSFLPTSGDSFDGKKLMAQLEADKHLLRHHVATHLRWRKVPEIDLKYDPQPAHTSRLHQILEQL